MCVDTDTGCTPETYPCSPHATVQPQLSQGLLESTVGAGVWPLVSAAGRSPAEMGLPLVHPLLGASGWGQDSNPSADSSSQ